MSSNSGSPDGASLGGFLTSVVYDIVTSPLNCTLLIICLVLIYNIVSGSRKKPQVVERKILPKMKKRDMTLEELRKYDGTNEEGRVLVSVCGKVFDVTYSGKQFYGPGGPYEVFAGRDASRALATFSLEVSALRTEYDDLSDLRSDQMSSLKEWELQFSEKYIQVGRLLKPGETPAHYSDDDDDEEASARQGATKSSATREKAE